MFNDHFIVYNNRRPFPCLFYTCPSIPTYHYDTRVCSDSHSTSPLTGTDVSLTCEWANLTSHVFSCGHDLLCPNLETLTKRI